MASKLLSVVAHRGYRLMFPENTLLAFNEALKHGTTFIETDLQQSLDGELLVSHDPSTKRCFGVPLTIQDEPFSALRALRTVQEPFEPILTFSRLLQWTMKKHEQGVPVRLMLDLKPVNAPGMVTLVLAALEASGKPLAYWHDRIVFGFWTEAYLRYAHQHHADALRPFEKIIICFSPWLLEPLLRVVDTLPGFQINNVSLFFAATWDPQFPQYHADYQRRELGVYVWTVNTIADAKWAARLGVCGVITDDVKTILDQALPVNTAKVSAYSFPSLLTREGSAQRRRYVAYKALEAMRYYGLSHLGAAGYTVESTAMRALKAVGAL